MGMWWGPHFQATYSYLTPTLAPFSATIEEGRGQCKRFSAQEVTKFIINWTASNQLMQIGRWDWESVLGMTLCH
jgi:hypothetical protein